MLLTRFIHHLNIYPTKIYFNPLELRENRPRNVCWILLLTNMHGRKHGLLEQNIKPMKFLCCVTPGPRGGRSHSFPKFIVTLIRKRRTRVPGVAIMSISNISNTLVMRSIVHLIYCSCSIV